GGAGIFYDFMFSQSLDAERAALGPTGAGRQTFTGSSIPNMLVGIPGIPVGLALDFHRPTAFTGANFISMLPAARAALIENLAGADPSVQQLQVTKTFTGGSLNPASTPAVSALHINLGLQREIAKGFVVSADFVRRRFNHTGLGFVDVNHFNSVRGPGLAKCTAAQKNDPQALCSNGPINFSEAAGRATYNGLLLRAEKRLTYGL